MCDAWCFSASGVTAGRSSSGSHDVASLQAAVARLEAENERLKKRRKGGGGDEEGGGPDPAAAAATDGAAAAPSQARERKKREWLHARSYAHPQHMLAHRTCSPTTHAHPQHMLTHSTCTPTAHAHPQHMLTHNTCSPATLITRCIPHYAHQSPLLVITISHYYHSPISVITRSHHYHSPVTTISRHYYSSHMSSSQSSILVITLVINTRTHHMPYAMHSHMPCTLSFRALSHALTSHISCITPQYAPPRTTTCTTMHHNMHHNHHMHHRSTPVPWW